MLFGPLATARKLRQPPTLSEGHTAIVRAAWSWAHRYSCNDCLCVHSKLQSGYACCFSNFANYYSVPVRISTLKSSISFDGEKCIFNNGIRHILLQRSILCYFFLLSTYKSWMCRDICWHRREILAQLVGSWFVFITLGVGVKDISCSGKATLKCFGRCVGALKPQFFKGGEGRRTHCICTWYCGADWNEYCVLKVGLYW